MACAKCRYSYCGLSTDQTTVIMHDVSSAHSLPFLFLWISNAKGKSHV